MREFQDGIVRLHPYGGAWTGMWHASLRATRRDDSPQCSNGEMHRTGRHFESCVRKDQIRHAVASADKLDPRQAVCNKQTGVFTSRQELAQDKHLWRELGARFVQTLVRLSETLQCHKAVG